MLVELRLAVRNERQLAIKVAVVLPLWPRNLHHTQSQA